MKTKKTATTLKLENWALLDKRIRDRIKRIITMAVIFALLGLSAGGLFAFVRQSKTAGVFLEPGLAVPVGLLVIAVVGSILLRRASREIRFWIKGDKLYRRPSFWARLAGISTKRSIALHAVSSVKVICGPWGNRLVLSGHEHEEEAMIPVPMNLACPDLYKELYNLLPRESWADKKERLTLSSLGGSIDRPQPEKPSSSQRSLMKDMGLWTLLSRESWSYLLDSDKDSDKDPDKDPDKDALMEIWRADRFRLDYSALLSLLDILLPFAGEKEELLFDALRLGLTFRIASLVEDALNLLGKSDESESSALELEKAEEHPKDPKDSSHIWKDWAEAQKRPPQVKAALPIMGARRYRLDPEQRLLMIGTSETLSIRYITAMCRRNGFFGTRILFIYDVWGQKHEITPANSPEPLDDFAARLTFLAPHVIELHEERSWSFGSRLRHHRLKKLLRDSQLISSSPKG